MADEPRSIRVAGRPRPRRPFSSETSLAKVLIVDDEYACRDSLGLLLSLENFDVETAADAKEALDIGVSFAPDVLIVDWMLSDDTDGLQIAEALRAVNPNVQIIVVTGYPSDDLEARVEAIPAAQYITKPYRPGELIAATRRAAGHPA